MVLQIGNVRAIEPKRVHWNGHIARMGKIINAYRISDVLFKIKKEVGG
jgi:hypothetical protein